MYARSRQLHFGSLTFSGPLLIPSISSKGFPRNNDGISESSDVLEFAHQNLTDAVLISAYDLHHGRLRDADKLLGPDHSQTVFATPKLLVVDSGGYELNPRAWEAGTLDRDSYTADPYSYNDYETVVDKLPDDRELLVVSYDNPADPRSPFGEQRERAQAFFGRRPHLRSDFLLKPIDDRGIIDVAALTPEARHLRVFDVIGVTESELGDDLLGRLKQLARLRSLLDSNGCGDKPIHVFGSLDPVWTPLYFMAGAEIFDGLSWLRYAYHNGLSIHRDELAVLTSELQASESQRHHVRFISNLAELRKLKDSLVRWADDQTRWEHLKPHAEVMSQIYATMHAELKQEG